MTEEPTRPDRIPGTFEREGQEYGKAPGVGDWKRITRLAALVVLVVYVVLFFMMNREKVEVSLVVTSVTIPVVWVLMLAFVLGMAVMYLLLYLRKRAVRKARTK